MKKIVCFGDSITEMGYVIELRGYVAQLADRYARRADVLARGFSGYTTRDALKVVQSAVLDEKPDVVVLFFGANDSVLPGQIQHVPLREYRKNLRDLATQIASSGAWLIMVTPPPVDEKKVKSRTMDNTADYAGVCAAVAQDMNVPIVDLFEKLQEERNWAKHCLLDGLHLSAAGMNCLYEELTQALDRIAPLDSFERIGVDGI